MGAIQKHEAAAEVHHLPADPMVSMIERLVVDPSADLDKLERMLAMKERIDAQNASKAYASALSQARAEIPPIIKDATVDFTSSKGHTQYRHETLAGIAKQIDPILSKYGLSYRFRTEQGNGGVKVTCVVQHRDGHAEETSLSGAPDGSGSKNSFQAVGSAVTYLQRYTLKAALGLSAEVDDDGQAAAPRNGQERQQRREEPRQQQRQEQRQEQRQPSNAERAADDMIASIKSHGADAVEADERFRHAFSRLRIADAEQAARVEVAIANWRESNKPRLGENFDPTEIPY